MNRDMSNRDEAARVRTLRRHLARTRASFGITQTKTGVWVRLLWRGGRPRIQKHFAGPDALQRAVAYRDLWIGTLYGKDFSQDA